MSIRFIPAYLSSTQSTKLVPAGELVIKEASGSGTGPPFRGMPYSVQLEADFNLVAGIDDHIQGHSGFICSPHPVTDVLAVTEIRRGTDTVALAERLLPPSFGTVDIFRKDVRIAHLLGIIILVGNIGLKVPYPRPVGAVGITCPKHSPVSGIILEMGGREQVEPPDVPGGIHYLYVHPVQDAILIVIAAILLVAVVLLQSGKGEGMASNFTSANQTLGVRQTADILEKVSWGLVTFILVVSIITSFTVRNQTSGVDVTDIIENVETQPEFPSAPIQQEAPSTEAPSTPAN